MKNKDAQWLALPISLHRERVRNEPSDLAKRLERMAQCAKDANDPAATEYEQAAASVRELIRHSTEGR